MKSLIFNLLIIQLIFINTILLSANADPIYETHHIAGLPPINDYNCPRIITREEWGARNAIENKYLLISPAPSVIIHDTDDPRCFNIDSCIERIRERQNYEMDSKFYNDIGFNFLIGEDGNVYEGRGWNYRGAHASLLNPYSIGIAVIGNFTNFIPKNKALKALDDIIECGVSSYKISPNYIVNGHRQIYNTSCPGQIFYEYVMSMMKWSSTSLKVRI